MNKLIHLRWLIVVILLGYLGWQNLLSMAPVVGESDLSVRQSNLGVLLPAGRVAKTEAGLRVKQEPLYLDIKIPPRARQVNLKITTAGQADLIIGSRQDIGWSYVFWPLTISDQAETKIHSVIAQPIGLLESDYNWRFILSVKGLPDKDLIIKKAEVEILRRPFSWQWLNNKLLFWL
ncbi:MAG: hypothetical protein ACOZAJ_03990 [Patescibacteria group bacterium]